MAATFLWRKRSMGAGPSRWQWPGCEGKVGAVNARVRPWRMLVVAAGWGSCFPLLDWGVRGGSALWFVTWRALIAGLALLCGVAVNRRRQVDRVVEFSSSMWGLVGALAILNVAVAFVAMAASVTQMTTGAASVLGNAQALLVVLPAWWLFGERPRVIEIVRVAVGFGGLMLVAAPTEAGRGAWLALLAAAAIAAGALLARRLAAVDVLVLGAAQFLIGTAILALAAAIIDGSPLNGVSARFVSAVVVLALAGSALPYALWFAELRRASITAVTSWTLLVPVVGLVLGVVVLGGPLTIWEILGSALVVAAMALVAKAGQAACDRLRCWQQSNDALTERR
jgi:probable blue pigment (indigoidine) exporter